MAFNVRIFGYRGVRQIEQVLPGQYTADTVFVADEPYLWSQVISVSSVAAASAVQSGDNAKFVRVEVPDGQAIRYELNPLGPSAVGARTASTNSPKQVGVDNYFWTPGATFSFIDAAALP